MEIKKVEFGDIKHLSAKASKESVSISDTSKTLWFAAYVDNEIVGCAGIYEALPYHRLKGIWIMPEYRGKGIGKKLTEHRLEYCEDIFVGVEVYALHPKFYKERGFVEYGILRGATKLRRKP